MPAGRFFFPVPDTPGFSFFPPPPVGSDPAPVHAATRHRKGKRIHSW